jgi:hypothetical protein
LLSACGPPYRGWCPAPPCPDADGFALGGKIASLQSNDSRSTTKWARRLLRVLDAYAASDPCGEDRRTAHPRLHRSVRPPHHDHRPGRQPEDRRPAAHIGDELACDAAGAHPRRTVPRTSTTPSSRPTPAHWTGEPLADPQSASGQEEYEVGKLTLDRLLIATEPLVKASELVRSQRLSAPDWLGRDAGDVAAGWWPGGDGLQEAHRRRPAGMRLGK